MLLLDLGYEFCYVEENRRVLFFTGMTEKI